MSAKKQRCWWAGDDLQYQAYHDHEWGRPVLDDRAMFEKICLEGFQAGLSWLTILRKRDHFRQVFHNFDVSIVARFGADDVVRLLGDPGIVRHRGKIEAVINNARKAIDLQQQTGSIARYFWSFEPAADERPRQFDSDTLKRHTTCASAIRLSKDLRKRGWQFVGPTTVYSFMQAMGIVNDHVADCPCRQPLLAMRAQMGTMS